MTADWESLGTRDSGSRCAQFTGRMLRVAPVWVTTGHCVCQLSVQTSAVLRARTGCAMWPPPPCESRCPSLCRPRGRLQQRHEKRVGGRFLVADSGARTHSPCNQLTTFACATELGGSVTLSARRKVAVSPSNPVPAGFDCETVTGAADFPFPGMRLVFPLINPVLRAASQRYPSHHKRGAQKEGQRRVFDHTIGHADLMGPQPSWQGYSTNDGQYSAIDVAHIVSPGPPTLEIYYLGYQRLVNQRCA